MSSWCFFFLLKVLWIWPVFNSCIFNLHVIYDLLNASGQDKLNNSELWLATWAGKMELSCPLVTTHCALQENFLQKPYNKSCLDQACSDKMTVCWPHSLFVCLWTSTLSWPINMQKKNLANIQPSWPHTWSMTHLHNAWC